MLERHTQHKRIRGQKKLQGGGKSFSAQVYQRAKRGGQKKSVALCLKKVGLLKSWFYTHLKQVPAER